MPESMQQEVIRCAQLAVEWHHNDRSAIANYLKIEFDRLFGRPWQCFVGSFSYFCRYEDNYYICFDIHQPKMRVVLFRTKDEVNWELN
jgi:hypothetical protein